MIDAIYPLAASAAFSTSSVMIKHLSPYKSASTLNFYRTLVGSIFFIIHFLFVGDWNEVKSLSFLIIGFLVLSVFFNVVTGDTFFFKSQEIIGVNVAFPIVNSYPIVTILFAVIFLSESISAIQILGTLVIIIGIVLVSYQSNNQNTDRSKLGWGLFLAFLATFAYAGGVIYTTLASSNIDSITANVVRMPAATILLAGYFFIPADKSKQYKPIDRNFIIIMIIAGMLGTYLASIFLVISTQKLGAGLTSILTALGPIFALPLTIYWLKEKINKRVIIGTILSILGLIVVLYNPS